MTKLLQEHPHWRFALKTLFYFVVILLLIYMYGYYGAGQEPFIYNEF
ncbi:teichoic acid D-Ala incorporation-associated protein DltX [Limosilactobacillus sp.]|nr:teichoic acid D-Ala incorporation-associated protein DltX [Limosilactobacillus sp.]MCH3921632.1 teichoic acid D-Ala incorporation-associated protein DltX [Limosilactobacillus sp.]MCH3928403.1 teichoic acid D-Ala incorporation-associated protein DltX [Limosilactobacillus sp.]